MMTHQISIAGRANSFEGASDAAALEYVQQTCTILEQWYADFDAEFSARNAQNHRTSLKRQLESAKVFLLSRMLANRDFSGPVTSPQLQELVRLAQRACLESMDCCLNRPEYKARMPFAAQPRSGMSAILLSVADTCTVWWRWRSVAYSRYKR